MAQKKRQVPIRIAIRQFKRFYGADYYHGTVVPWPTRDRVIPWKLFWLEWHDMHNVLALERLNMMAAVLLADVLSKPAGDAASKVQDLLEQNLDEAYPKE